MNTFIKTFKAVCLSKDILKSFAIKASIAASAIYYVRQQGVWKNSDEAIETANRLKSAVSPYVQEVKAQLPIELPDVPETENVCQLAKEFWNIGVRTTFSFLIQLPKYTRVYTRKAADAMLENPEIKNVVNSFSYSESPKTTTK